MWRISFADRDNVGQDDCVRKAIKILRKIACSNGGGEILNFYNYFTLYDLKKESHPLTIYENNKYRFGVWFDAFRWQTQTYLTAKQFLKVFFKTNKYVILNEGEM